MARLRSLKFNVRASFRDEIEQKTGIRHESPQVIVLDKGNVVWNASHWKVTAQAVAKAVEQSGK